MTIFLNKQQEVFGNIVDIFKSKININKSRNRIALMIFFVSVLIVVVSPLFLLPFFTASR